jgi:GrpB-like predicted nucleotidyltransferase (UPF0157 family)
VITLHLAPYDPQWPARFEEHRSRIAAALGEQASRIEHIGSTSVPGLAAKPIIDVIVGGVMPDDPRVRTALETAGYDLIVDEDGHAMFAAPDRSAHVHLWEQPSEFDRHVLFRNWLREHPEDRALYEHVKREFVKREWETQNHYAEAKTAVVNTIMRRARGEVSEPRIESFTQLLAQYLPQHARVLEIGAGEGLLAARLAAAGHDVVAIDTQLRSTFPIVESSFEDFGAAAQSFDCVVAQLVLHHAADLEAMLDKIVHLLKPDGLIAIDDYGWERSDDPQFRADRSDLHTSETMLAALRLRFAQLSYADHAHINDGAGNGRLGFTFIGRSKA